MTIKTDSVSVMRSALFVPGTRPERFPKALAAGADAVIIDLEDAVEQDHKDQARDHIHDFANANPGVSFLVRVNGATTPWFEKDLALCASLPSVQTVVLPKTESPEQISQITQTGKSVLPIVESAKGVLALARLAASGQVTRLSFGPLDLMSELEVTADTDAAHTLLSHVRCQILLHSAANGLAQPLDGVYPDFSDAAGLQAHARYIKQMGFAGMLCIHPAQISPVHDAFRPGTDELQWARRVVDYVDRTGSSVFQLDGKMVDAPVIQRAYHVLERV